MPNSGFESLNKRLMSFTTDKAAKKATLEVEALQTEVSAMRADLLRAYFSMGGCC